MTIYVSKVFQFSLWFWAILVWSGSGFNEPFGLWATVLSTSCNTGYCQGPLLTMYLQLLGWRWLMKQHLRLSQLFSPHFSLFALWSSGHCVVLGLNIANRLSATICLKNIRPGQDIPVKGRLLSWAFCWLQFVNNSAWYAKISNDAACGYSSMFAYCALGSVAVLRWRYLWGHTRHKRADISSSWVKFCYIQWRHGQ